MQLKRATWLVGCVLALVAPVRSQGPSTKLWITGDPAELSGTTNNSVVTPATGPQGTLRVTGGGSVNFAAANAGNGVYFLNAEDPSNKAYYRFNGAGLGTIFDVNQGEVEFYFKSRHTLAQRQGSSYRTVFAAQDTPGNYPFYFIVLGSRFQYRLGSSGAAGDTYYLSGAQQTAILSPGATTKVKLAWDGSLMRLYLNDVLLQATPYTKAAVNWSANSLFSLGIDDPGGYNTCDDIIDEFMVRSNAAGDSTSPTVAIDVPVPGTTVSGTVTVSATASDNIGVAGVQFKLDGNQLGLEVTAPFNLSWNTAGVSNGSHRLTALARDAAGNTATSAGVDVTVANATDTTPPVRSAGAPSGTLAAGTSATTISLASNENATCRYATSANTAYGSMPSVFATTGGTTHSTSVSGLVSGNSYVYYVRCLDAIGNANADDYTISFSVAAPSDVTPPAISNVASFNITSSSATISWTTNEASDSQVEYGLTAGLGSSTALNGSLLTSHSVILTGLSSSTTYYFQVKSRDAFGNLGVAANFQLTTLVQAQGFSTKLWITGEPAELSGIANNAVVTPTVGPQGTLKVTGGGSINFAAANTGNGVYFLNAENPSNKAYYRFDGAGLGTIFDVNQGEAEFYFRSRSTLAQRQGGAFRTVFAVQDAPGNYPFYFIVFGSRFQYRLGSSGAAGDTYYLSAAQQTAILGLGAITKVKLAWDGSLMRLYLNDVLLQITPYTKAALNWSANSLFTLGIDDPAGYNTCDDIIDEFIVRSNAAGDSTSPTVAIDVPAPGTTVSGTVAVSATASDNIGVAGVQFKLDGNNLGLEVGAPFNLSWNTTGVSNGGHQLTAVARDAAGNTATSIAVGVTVANATDTTPAVRSAGAPSGTLAAGTGTTTISLATNENSTCRYAIGANTAYGSMAGVFGATGGTTHSTSVSGLVSGNSYVYYVRCQDGSGNTNPDDYAISFSVAAPSDATPPVISNVASFNITSSSATISWTTDEASDSQVKYGLTAALGSSTALNGSLVTSHSVILTGLSSSNTYHFQVQSRDAFGNLGVAANFQLTTAVQAQGLSTKLWITGEAAELSGITDHAVVTPTAGPQGTLEVVGGGSVNFAAANTGNGVYFLSAENPSNKAYYRFNGAALGTVFDSDQGEVEFYFQSRSTVAQRLVSSYRTVFAVQDVPGNYPFYFIVLGSRLQYRLGSSGAGGSTYYLSGAQQTAVLSPGAGAKVKLTWDGSLMRLYLNDVLLQATAYTKAAVNWSANSVFTLGIDGPSGYNTCDDIIDEFIVRSNAAGDSTSPAVSITVPVSGATVSGTATVSATASDNIGVAGVQFILDGNNLGLEVTTPFNLSWDTTGVANGSHQLTAVARDAAGNTSAATAVDVTVGNAADIAPPVPSASAPGGTLAAGTGTVTLSLATNENATCRYATGANTAYVWMPGAFSTTGGTTHSTSVSGLVSGNSYVYYVRCRDASGNANPNDYAISFSVAAPSDTTPPTISNVHVVSATFNTVTIAWTTDQAADSQAQYGQTATYGGLSILDTALAVSHTITITSLAPQTTYHYHPTSRNTYGIASTAGDFIFTTGSAPPATDQVNWTQMTPNATWPGYDGLLQLFYDDLSQKTLVYSVLANSNSIYASDVFFYDAATNNFTHLGGTGAMGPACTLDTPTQPGERHPYWQMAMDTKRQYLWMASGSNATCNGVDPKNLADLYYLDLRATPPAWHQVLPAHPVQHIISALIHDPDSDVLFLFGGSPEDAHFLYCPTLGTANPGVMTAKQVAAGCAAPDDWTTFTPNGGIATVSGTDVTRISGQSFANAAVGDYIVMNASFYRIVAIPDVNHLALESDAGASGNQAFYIMPMAVGNPGMVYDDVHKKVLLFGGNTQNASIYHNQIWEYDVPARTWSHLALNTVTPPVNGDGGVNSNQPAMAYNSSTHRILYHQVSATDGGPADWEYDPAADTWRRLTSTGMGPSIAASISYDPARNILVAWANSGGGAGTPPEIWIGQLVYQGQ